MGNWICGEPQDSLAVNTNTINEQKKTPLIYTQSMGPRVKLTHESFKFDENALQVPERISFSRVSEKRPLSVAFVDRNSFQELEDGELEILLDNLAELVWSQ